MNDSKIEVLDSLRGFAAISVCLFHFVCATTGYIKNETLLSLFSFGKYGVQAFFVISGFVIPWSMFKSKYRFKHFFTFFLKRVSRLEPPYLFSIALALVVLLLRERILGLPNSHIQVSTKQVLLHIGYLIPFSDGYQWLNQVYWTLAIEFQYYLVIALLFIPLIKSTLWIRWLIYATLIYLSYFGSDSFLPHWMPIFLFGITLFLFMSGLILATEYYLTLVLLIICCVFKYNIESVIFCVIPVVCVLFIKNKKLPGLNFLGKFSYSIYLIHPVIGATFINRLSHTYTTTASKLIVIFGGLLITLIGAFLTYWFIERPSKKYSTSIKYNSNKADG